MEKKQKLSWKFYALLGTATFGVVGGLYYLYNLLSNPAIEISDEQKEKIENLTKIYQNVNDAGLKDSKEKKEIEITLKILKQINELCDELFKKEYPDWEFKRRQILKDNNISEYNSFCEYIVSEKMWIESIAAEIILQKLNISQLELQFLMEKIPQHKYFELQKQMLEKTSYNKPNPEKFNSNTLILAFKKFISKKNEIDNQFKNIIPMINENDEEGKMELYAKMEINKHLIDDYLMIEFDIDAQNLLDLIHIKGLNTNKDIEGEFNNLINEFKIGMN